MRKIAWLALVPLFGCGRSCADHPYVPYAIGDGTSLASSQDAGEVSVPVVLLAQDAGASAMQRAPENAATWDVFGVTLTAPDDRLLAFAVNDAAHGNVLALLRSKADPEARAQTTPGPVELVGYHVEGAQAEAPKTLLTTKDDVLDATCAPVATAQDFGESGIFVGISYACAGHGALPARTFALVAKTNGALRVRLAVRVRDTESDPPTDLQIDPADVDHDGVPDVTLRADIGGATAKIVLVDRPAGLSRSTGEPEASFAALERTAAAHVEKKDAKGALAVLQKLRALYRALCQEPSPRVTLLAGAAPWACNANATLRRAEVTEARARAMDGDRLRALFELDVAARLGEKVDPKILAPYVDTVTVRDQRVFSVLPPKPARGAIGYSPLAFDADGSLLARLSDTEVVKLDGTTLPPSTTPSSTAAWTLALRSPDGARRLIEAYDPCDESAVRLTFAGATSTEDVSVPVEPLLGRKCEGARGGAVSIAPIAWTDAGVSLLANGQYVYITSMLQPTPMPRPSTYGATKGSAAAGAFVVLRTPFGLALDDGKKTHLLRDSDNKPVEGISCTVVKSGDRIACLTTTGTVLLSL